MSGVGARFIPFDWLVVVCGRTIENGVPRLTSSHTYSISSPTSPPFSNLNIIGASDMSGPKREKTKIKIKIKNKKWGSEQNKRTCG